MRRPASAWASTLLVGALLLLGTAAPAWAAPQTRVLFAEEQFDRTGGAPDIFQRPFTIPSYLSAPYTLHIINGTADGSRGKAIEGAVSSGHVFIDGMEVVSPRDFKKSVGKTEAIDKPLALTPGSHLLEVQLASAPDSFIRLTIDSVINLGDLTQARSGHAAALLDDGRLLITGGTGTTGVLDKAEVFDPVTLTSNQLANTLTTPRTEHTATPLPRAETLLVAGEDTAGSLFTTEVFHPTDSAFTKIAPEIQPPRSGHAATGLLDGRVVILGGLAASSLALADAEVFDAVPDPLSALLYDPDTGSFTSLPNALREARSEHSVTRLPGGLLLVVGGRNEQGELASVELFDPALGSSTPLTATLTTPRAGHAATRMPDGTVLISGGTSGGTLLDSMEVYDPVAQTLTPLATTLLVPRTNHTANLLPIGEILIAGGEGTSGPLAHTELVEPLAADTLAPLVQTVSPPDLAAPVALNTIIALGFSEPLDVGTITPATLTLTGPTGAVPSLVSPGEGGLSAFVVPQALLAVGTTFTMEATGLKDLAGNALPLFTSTFTTVAAPSITSFSPESGSVGTVVTIVGNNFAPELGPPIVEFNGVLAHVDDELSSNTSLTAIIRTGATTGPITVTTTGGTASTAPNEFAVLTGPVITGLTRLTGPVGTPVTITGQNFDPVAGNNQVDFNGTPAIIASATTTTITTTVPQDTSLGPNTITVTTPDGTATSPQPFTVTLAQDFVINVLPATLTVPASGQVAFAVSLSARGGFTNLATLAVTGVPTGATATFTAATLTAGQSTLLMIVTNGTTLAATNSVTVSATGLVDGTEITRTASVNVQVQAAGVTSLTGQVLDEEANPVKGANVILGSLETTTDDGGNFLLLNPPVGADQQLFIDGGPASTPEHNFPIIPYKVTIVAGQANTLGFTPHLHFQKTTGLVDISNSGVERIVTDREIPGFQMTIPAGATIIGWDGQPNTQISVRRVPVDRNPLPPLPAGVHAKVIYMDYFGKQGGGTASVPIPITFPNDVQALPGTQVGLWFFDEAPDGSRPNQWVQYGTGTVSADGTQVVPDIAPATGQPFGVERFCCGGQTTAGPPDDASGSDGTAGGEPVDLATGFFRLEKIDLVLPGRLPVAFTRTYGINGPPINGPFGPRTSHSYDIQLTIQSDVRRLVLPDGRQFLFLRQLDGTFKNNTDPLFRGAVLTQTSPGHVLRLKDGTTWSFNTPAAGFNAFLIQQADRNGNTITLTRDSSGIFLTGIIDAAGRQITVSSGAGGRITEITDPLGRTVRYGYDSNLRLATVTDPSGAVTRYTYDAQGRMLTITDGRGITFLTNGYDSADRVIRQTQADGGIWQFEYTVTGGVLTTTKLTDPNGHPTTYRFNGRGYLLEQTDGLGQSTKFGKDSETNLLNASMDTLGRKTSFTYDAAGNVTTITDPDGNTTSFTYEPTFNRVTSITDGLNQVTTFAYDAKGNLLSTTDPLNQTTTIAYNAFGQPTSVTDPLNNTTTFDYDTDGNLMTTTDPLGNSTQRAYDAVGRLISLTDPRGFTTQFRYDPLNRVATIADPRQGVTAFNYDPNGNLLEVTDAKGQTTSYTYEVMDRLETRTDALNRTEFYEYDPNGNLTQFTDRKNQVSTFEYDVLDRRTVANYADGSASSFTYDSVGRLTRATDSTSGPIELAYDNLDRLIQELTTQGIIEYAYDALGRRTTMTANGQQPVTYGYDVASRLLQVAQGTQVVGLGYNAAGLRTSLTYPNGTNASYTYDAASRLLHILHEGPTGVIENLTYTYDAAGNRISFNRSSGTATLLPDAVQAAYDVANEQIQFNSGSPNLTYDANGNLTSQTDASGTTNYVWDARNRLVGISGPSLSASFSYDALGRRVSKTINGITTDYQYDGNDIAAEIGGGAVSALYLRSLNVDEPFVRQSSSNEYYHADALGSVQALTNIAATITASYAYEAFGRTTITGVSSNPFQYTGRENDGTGLYFYRARYYSPVTRRLLSEDLLHLGSAQLLRQVTPDFGAVSAFLFRHPELLNGYAYVINNPINFVDPLGLVLTPGQQLAVSLISSVGAGVGTVLLPAAPIGGAALGGAVAGAVAAAVLGGDPKDVTNAAIGGAISGATGGFVSKFLAPLGSNAIQRGLITGVVAGFFNLGLLGADPALGAELGPEGLGRRK